MAEGHDESPAILQRIMLLGIAQITAICDGVAETTRKQLAREDSPESRRATREVTAAVANIKNQFRLMEEVARLDAGS